MSCFGSDYNPQPTRAWSRLDNNCQNIPSNVDIAMLKKGNVLQYVDNSYRITKNQKYSKIANKNWITRKTYGTQSHTYTNPNKCSLRLINYTTINEATGAPINGPVTCPDPPIYRNPTILPINKKPSKPKKNIPPPPPKPSVVIIIPDIYPPTPPPQPVIIPNGGVLLCPIIENFCTGEIISNNTDINSPIKCNPTTSSNVPGPIQNLCWNNNTQALYTRMRYKMFSGLDKFPQGYKFS